MATAKKKDYLWFVKAPGHVQVPVIAQDWEQATLEAARFWGVKWAEIFWQCELVKKTDVIRNMCCRPGGGTGRSISCGRAPAGDERGG